MARDLCFKAKEKDLSSFPRVGGRGDAVPFRKLEFLGASAAWKLVGGSGPRAEQRLTRVPSVTL